MSKTTVSAPANIAFIKYWGAHDLQRALPMNSSISMTLEQCVTLCTVEVLDRAGGDEIWLAEPGGGFGTPDPEFAGRIRDHLDRIRKWAGRRDEFVKRAAFALLASVALKDRAATDAQFLRCLPLIEKAAHDERNFVKKGVNWALRGVGSRNLVLHTAAVALARKLAAADASAPRWVGKDALRQLASAATLRRVKRRSGADA